MKKIMLILLFLLPQCQSTPGSNVRVGNERPGEACEEVGQVIGTSGSRENSQEKAMSDLKHEASLKSANYVRVIATSAYGAAIRGIAYRCP